MLGLLEYAHLVAAERRKSAPPPKFASRRISAGRPDVFTDDEVLPVFEAALDLPRIVQSHGWPQIRLRYGGSANE